MLWIVPSVVSVPKGSYTSHMYILYLSNDIQFYLLLVQSATLSTVMYIVLSAPKSSDQGMLSVIFLLVAAVVFLGRWPLLFHTVHQIPEAQYFRGVRSKETWSRVFFYKSRHSRSLNLVFQIAPLPFWCTCSSTAFTTMYVEKTRLR